MGALDQGLATFSSKEPENKYFWLRGLYSLFRITQLYHCSTKATIDNPNK